MLGDIMPVDGHKVESQDLVLAKTIGDTLEKHYPGWAWMVHVDSEGEIVNIMSGVLNEFQVKMYGFTYHLHNLTYSHKAATQKAIKAGGELLERANMPRSRWTGQEIPFGAIDQS